MENFTIQSLEELDYHTNEAYKTLRTNIVFSGDDIKCVAVTSCTQNEGKTTVAFNLARALAEMGSNVIYIDADMRKSVIASRMEIENKGIGLAHYLTGINTLDEVIGITNINNLHMIVSGLYPPNPSELLSGVKFEEMIKTLKEEYKYIIIDTPPLGIVVDAAVIARKCDGVAIVIAQNKLSYKFVLKIKKQLQASGCKILGAILNFVNKTKESGYYGSYNGYEKDYEDYENRT